MNTVERVARAIYEKSLIGTKGAIPWDELKAKPAFAMAQAAAAIAAYEAAMTKGLKNEPR